MVCSADDWKNWGVGPGVDFQSLTKNCPAFAVEYGALVLRKVRNYSGAINNRHVELGPEADDLFRSVCAFIDSNGITEV